MAVYKDENFQWKFDLPPDETPVTQKQNDPSYSLAWLKYMYWCYTSDRVAITHSRQQQIQSLRLYAQGKQDWEQYKKRFTKNLATGNARIPISSTLNDVSDNGVGGTYMESVQDSKAHFMAVDFTKIFSPAPKFMRSLVGMFMKVNHDISVTAIDPYSASLREEQKWGLWVKSKTKQDFSEINKIIGIPDPDETEVLPQTLEELNLYEQIKGFKLRYETAMEEALLHTDDLSVKREIKSRCILDLVTANVAFTTDYIDDTTYKVMEDYVDPCEVIIEYNRNNRFEESRFAGHIMYYTVSQLKRYFPDVQDNEWHSLCSKYLGIYGNPATLTQYIVSQNTENPSYYEFRVPVLRGSFRTVDYPTKRGYVSIPSENVREAEVKKGKIKKLGSEFVKEVDKQIGSINAVYEAKWIIGTDYLFDYGRIRDDSGLLPYHGYMLEGSSIVEQMVPSLDSIQMTYIRMQNIIAKAPPPGLAIDIAGLKGFKMGNTKWQPTDLIRMYSQSGHLLYDSSLKQGVMPNDKVDSRKMIDNLPGGIGSAINEYIVLWEKDFNHIAEITGLSRQSFVTSTTNPQETATAQRLMAAGTVNALEPLYGGWINMRTSMFQNIAYRIQIICINTKGDKKLRGYVPVIGEDGVQAIAQMGKIDPNVYGIMIEPAPTQDEKQEIIMQVRDAQAKQLIDPAVALFIVSGIMRGRGLNKLHAYLAYQIDMARKQAAEAAEAAQMRDRETQMMVAKGKMEGEVQVMDFELKGEKEKIILEKDLDLRNEREKHKMKMEELQLTAQYKQTNV